MSQDDALSGPSTNALHPETLHTKSLVHQSNELCWGHADPVRGQKFTRPPKRELLWAALTWTPWGKRELQDLCTESFPLRDSCRHNDRTSAETSEATCTCISVVKACVSLWWAWVTEQVWDEARQDRSHYTVCTCNNTHTRKRNWSPYTMELTVNTGFQSSLGKGNTRIHWLIVPPGEGGVKVFDVSLMSLLVGEIVLQQSGNIYTDSEYMYSKWQPYSCHCFSRKCPHSYNVIMLPAVHDDTYTLTVCVCWGKQYTVSTCGVHWRCPWHKARHETHHSEMWVCSTGALLDQ